MANCGQACPYNTLDGCKVKEYNAICPLTNMATPVTEYRMTNADRIRAMTDEELAIFVRAVIMADGCPNGEVDCNECSVMEICNQSGLYEHEKEWLQQPAEGE